MGGTCNCPDDSNRIHERLVTHPSEIPFDLLLKCYTPLIWKAARKMGFFAENPSNQPEGMELSDAYQAGSIGLWQASMSFNPDLVEKSLKYDDPFLPYAFVKIWQEISNEKRRCQWMLGSRRRRISDPPVTRWPLHDYVEDKDSPSQTEFCVAEIWDDSLKDDAFDQAAFNELKELMGKEVSAMDFNRRSVYYGWMQHQQPTKQAGRKHARKNISDLRHIDRERVVDVLGLSTSRVYQLRADIRKKLRMIH